MGAGPAGHADRQPLVLLLFADQTAGGKPGGFQQGAGLPRRRGRRPDQRVRAELFHPGPGGHPHPDRQPQTRHGRRGVGSPLQGIGRSGQGGRRTGLQALLPSPHGHRGPDRRGDRPDDGQHRPPVRVPLLRHGSLHLRRGGPLGHAEEVRGPGGPRSPEGHAPFRGEGSPGQGLELFDRRAQRGLHRARGRGRGFRPGVQGPVRRQI